MGGESFIKFEDNLSSEGVFSAGSSNSVYHHITASSIALVVALEVNSLGIGAAVGDAGCDMLMGGIETVSYEGAADDSRVERA